MNLVVLSKVRRFQTDNCERVEQLFLLACQGRYLAGTWRVGSPSVCLPLGARAKAYVWAAATDRRSEGEEKEKLTMGAKHALLRSCFGAVYVIKIHSAFTFHSG